MAALELCKKLFKTKDVYKVFGVDKKASSVELKKAYYKISLKLHPDKVSDDEKSVATEKFQLLSKLYSLLSDEKKRDVFDKTGEIGEDDDFGLNDDRDWMEYWRELFPPVKIEDIDKFSAEYKGSEEELEDLKSAYKQHKGDMDKIMDSMMCSTLEDEPRYREILEPLIKSKVLPTYTQFTHEKDAKKRKRVEKAKKEEKEAAKMKDKIDNDLILALQKNQQKRGNILSYLEEKYAQQEDSSADDLVIDFKQKSSTSSKGKQSTTSTKQKRKAASSSKPTKRKKT